MPCLQCCDDVWRFGVETQVIIIIFARGPACLSASTTADPSAGDSDGPRGCRLVGRLGTVLARGIGTGIGTGSQLVLRNDERPEPALDSRQGGGRSPEGGNALNQYTAIDSRSACVVNPAEQLRYDLDGNLTNAGMVQADFDVDGDVDMPDYYNYFSACFNGANRPPKAGCPSPATDLDGDADVDQGDYSLFQACFNGANAPPKCNSAVPVRYTWDGENRLKAVEPMTPVNGVSKKVEFAYDYMNRRVQKKVYNRTSGAWVLATDQRFVYDRWNVVMVVNSSGTPQQTYTWGLDLSGLGGLRGDSGSAGIHGAGGIGRLLAVEETATEGSPKYWFFYDGNGNVGQLLQYTPGSPPTVALAGRYEYDPYGNVIGPDVDGDGQWTDDATAYALANPFRFSTKWFDTELGTGHELYYYGYRYYSPRLGRWLSRDPIGEAGGLNLLGYVGNAPVVSHDSLGLWDCVKGACEPPTPPPPPSPPQSTTSPSGCPWPAFPSDPPGASPGTACFDLPPGEDMWNPWLRWFVERHEGENVSVCPTSRWGRRVLGLDTTAKLEHDADAAISSLLGADCKCGGNANAVGSQAAFVQTKDFDRTTLLDDPFAFFSIGGLHLHASASCNVNHCCRSCSASCRVYYEVFDSWHFDLNPYNSGGLQSFWWTIRYSKNRQFDVKCTRH
jgi:RHS repeat-associated protein